MNKILLTLAVAAALLTLLTFALPQRVHVERRAFIDAPADALYALAISNAGYQEFNPYKSADPELEIRLFGPSSGVGSGFRFDGADGNGTQTIARVEANRAVEFAIEMDDYGPATQTLAFESRDGGTEVTWTMDKDMGQNPIARVFGLFMDSMIGKHFNKGLENLTSVTAA